ncbi:MAG TPA: LysR family transcriptional regulator [Gemmatimonadaceae bacterium]|nr:LysR family transcriptional regulator [Gemmatimonadaceae bacterium]
MDSLLLRAFLETVDAGSLSRAARTLGVSQPSLTQQIQRLERHFGAPLFRRHGRGVAPTEAGAALIPRARRILDELREAEDAIRRHDEAPAVLQVGVIPTVAPYLVPDALRRLRGQHPAQRVSIHEQHSAALMRMLADGALDLGIAAQPYPFDPALEVEALGADPLVVAVPTHHPAARAGAITLAELRDAPAITLDAVHCLSDQVAEFCARQGIHPAVACRGAQLATVLELVAAGVGVSVVPAMAASRHSGTACVFVPLAEQPLSREIVAVWPPRRGRPPVAEAFAECLRSVVRGW